MNKRRHMLFLMAFLSLCLLTVPVFAKNKEKQRKEDKTTQITIKQEATETTATTEKSTEAEKNSVYFSFAIYKDQDITLADIDIFKITLQDTSGNAHTIELNAYESSMAAIDNTIDEGEYTVTAIEYKGINQDIINNGFGLAKQINLSTTDTPEIPFYLGKQSTTISGLFVVKNNKVVESSTASSTQQTLETTQNVAGTTSADMDEENTTGSVSKDPSKEEVVEVIKPKTEKKTFQFFPFSFTKFFMALVLMGICGIWTFIFYKKNK